MKQNSHKNFTPLDFGFYDRSTKKALHKHYDPKGIPQDEKYHWYKVGQFDLDKSTILWGFYWLVQCDLSEFHRLADGVKNANLVTAWVHIKITLCPRIEKSQRNFLGSGNIGSSGET